VSVHLTERLADLGEMVPRVAQGVILDDELRGDRGAVAQAEGRGGVELLVRHLPHRFGGGARVASQERDRVGQLRLEYRDDIACRHLIEELKRRVPIWKRERYDDGTEVWVDPTTQAAPVSEEREGLIPW